MRKLVILDFSTLETHIYDIREETIVDETFIEHLGYNLSECQWMVGNMYIKYHRETL